MDLKTFAEHMYPFWILGVMVLGLVIAAGQKHILRIERKPVLKWFAFLGIITAIRFLACKFFHLQGMGSSANQITALPPLVALTVWWEDLCHTVPLFIFRKLIGNNKWWTKLLHSILMTAVMVEFGLGHLYQSVLAAFLLSFYIPYTLKKGEQYGFGTIMICHVTYDFVTLIFVRYLLGM